MAGDDGDDLYAALVWAATDLPTDRQGRGVAVAAYRRGARENFLTPQFT